MDVLAKRSFCVGLILVCLALTGTVTDAQNYRGEAVPVVERVDPVDFSRMRFLTFAFGREGLSVTDTTAALATPGVPKSRVRTSTLCKPKRDRSEPRHLRS